MKTPHSQVAGNRGQGLALFGSWLTIALAVIVILPLLAEAAIAGPFEDGHLLYKQRNFTQACKILRPLADKGDAKSQYFLGRMYGFGEGVPQNYVQAYMWFTLAASRFSPGEDRDKTIQACDWMSMQMSPSQIAEAKRLAREWRPIAPKR